MQSWVFLPGGQAGGGELKIVPGPKSLLKKSPLFSWGPPGEGPKAVEVLTLNFQDPFSSRRLKSATLFPPDTLGGLDSSLTHRVVDFSEFHLAIPTPSDLVIRDPS